MKRAKLVGQQSKRSPKSMCEKAKEDAVETTNLTNDSALNLQTTTPVYHPEAQASIGKSMEKTSQIPNPRGELHCFAAALEYCKMAYHVIPIGNDKRPLLKKWRRYQNTKPTEVEIQR